MLGWDRTVGNMHEQMGPFLALFWTSIWLSPHGGLPHQYVAAAGWLYVLLRSLYPVREKTRSLTMTLVSEDLQQQKMLFYLVCVAGFSYEPSLYSASGALPNSLPTSPMSSTARLLKNPPCTNFPAGVMRCVWRSIGVVVRRRGWGGRHLRHDLESHVSHVSVVASDRPSARS